MSKKDFMIPPKPLDMVNAKESHHRKTYRNRPLELETRRIRATSPPLHANQSYDQTNYKNLNRQHGLYEIAESGEPPIESFSPVPETDPRHWTFLFQNLQTAIMRIYYTAQHDNSSDKCKEVMHVLQRYWRGFHALIDKITPVSLLQSPVDYDNHSEYRNTHYQNSSIPKEVRTAHFRQRNTFEATNPYFQENEELRTDSKNWIKQNEVTEHYKPHESEEIRKPHQRRDLPDVAEDTITDGTKNKPIFLSKRPNSTKHISDKDQYMDRSKSPRRHLSNKPRESSGERSVVLLERDKERTEGTKLYEKLFPDIKRSKGVQREIEKFNEVLQRTENYNDAFNDSDKESPMESPIHSNHDALDNLTKRSNNMFEFTEDEVTSEHTNNYNESNDDENSEKVIQAEEIPQMDDRLHFQGHASNKTRHKQDNRSPQLKLERSSSDLDSGPESHHRRSSFISPRKNRTAAHSENFASAEYELD